MNSIWWAFLGVFIVNAGFFVIAWLMESSDTIEPPPGPFE